MIPGGLDLDGNVVELALFAVALSLLTVAFLTGRLEGLRRRGAQQLSIDALTTVRQAEEAHLDKLRKQQEGILKEGLRAEDKIDRWKTMEHDHQALSTMRQELDAFEREESQRIDALERLRSNEAQRLTAIQAALDSYPQAVAGDDEAWQEVIAERKSSYDRLQQDTEEAKQALSDTDDRRTRMEDEVVKLERRRLQLQADIDAAQERLEQIKQGQTDLLKPEHERLLQEVEELREQVTKRNEELREQHASLQAKSEKINEALIRLAALEAVADGVGGATIQFPADALSVAVKEMPGAAGGTDALEKLSAFRSMPECLRGYEDALQRTDEDDFLSSFEETLEELGLQYPGQIIRAFHTALKVNDLSPLTVLSGLSGTGKSQLPRAYARFFGIHFLHVPVEPGWDSPQDLLGFYDFVSERYRPTDRARALGHFDSQFSKEIGIAGDRSWADRMLIILLDEMNLARTEYYFSEFLSRLEMRGPRTNGGETSDSRSDAQISIDLPYAEGERPKHLYVPHNVIWVGTLNEDETTQALSDKVLDRANSIRFAPPKPGTLRQHSKAPERGVKAAAGYLPYERWLGWSKRGTTIEAGTQEIDETLEELASLMQKASRGFGFRIAQSIRAYIDRYPGQDWRVPMIDQINMRLLPKLAGAEMSACQDTMDGLRRLCEDVLGSPEFAEALQQAETASEATQIFTWPGYTYEEG